MPEQIGPYRVVSELAPGVGAMGRVFIAQHTETLGLYALKLPKNLALDNPEERQAFINEGDVLQRLRHENIVRIFETGVHENTAYIVMEYVDGESLHDVMRRERALPPDRVLELARGIATGLEAAHAQGVIHRDIKPANILIRKDGCVKIADFGVARVVDDRTVVQSMMFVGAYRYAAPEVAEGTSSARSDLYSLGVVMYEALTGAPPFDGTSLYEIMANKKKGRPDLGLLKRASPSLGPIVAGLLQPNPRARTASATALLRDLDAAAARSQPAPAADPTKELPIADPTTGGNPPRFPRGRARWLAGISGAAVIILGVAAGAMCMTSGGGGLASDSRSPTPSISPTAPPPTQTPPAVTGFPQQTLISYGDRTLTASVACGEGGGLRGLDALDPNTAVLFDLPENQPIPAWGAPDYAFPIDVVFVDDQKTVVSVFADIQPDSLIATSDIPIRYALEFSSGGAARHGFSAGTALDFSTQCASAAVRQPTAATIAIASATPPATAAPSPSPQPVGTLAAATKTPWPSPPALPLGEPLVDGGSMAVSISPAAVHCNLGESATIDATVTDMDGNAVPDGTVVDIDAAALASIDPSSSLTVDGVVSAAVTPLSGAMFVDVAVQSLGGVVWIRLDCIQPD